MRNSLMHDRTKKVYKPVTKRSYPFETQMAPIKRQKLDKQPNKDALKEEKGD